jgi:hypothetical protein
MTNPGIPTTSSHSNAVAALISEANALLINGERLARVSRIDMAAGSVDDIVIKDVWDFFSRMESRLLEIRTASDFHDEYARDRGLAYAFNCTDDINASTEKIINLPANHKFKTDHRVEFILIQGSLTSGLSEGTNYWVRTVDKPNGTITLTTTEGGGSDINLSNATGTAEMIVNIKPDYSSILTAVDAILDEVEANLALRLFAYDRANLDYTYSTRTTGNTATLRTKFSDLEALIDVIAA